MLGPKGVISVNESTKLVQLLWKTPDSCISSWIVHRLFVGASVLLYNFAGNVVERQPTTGFLNIDCRVFPQMQWRKRPPIIKSACRGQSSISGIQRVLVPIERSYGHLIE